MEFISWLRLKFSSMLATATCRG